MADKYKDKRKEYWRTYRQRLKKIKMGIIDLKVVDYHMVKLEIPTPHPEEGMTKTEKQVYVRDKVDEIVAKAQKEVRREWARRGNTNNIIILQEGPSHKETTNIKCEIHQLKMDKEKIKEFDEVCKQCLNNNYLKEKQNEEMD